MGELEIYVEGSCRLGVGGASSCSMVLLWLIGEASSAKDFAPQYIRGVLEKGCILPATWSDLEKAKAYMPGGAAKPTQRKKGVVIKVKVHLGKGVTVDSQHHPKN
jgi:hypothetical protein